MSQYEEMDRRILNAIDQGHNPLYSGNCRDEADRIARLTRREEFRVIDGRLQSLRKAGKIRHFTKSEKTGGGWHLVNPVDKIKEQL